MIHQLLALVAALLSTHFGLSQPATPTFHATDGTPDMKVLISPKMPDGKRL